MTAAGARKGKSASHAPPYQAAAVVAGVVALWGASFVSIPIGPVPITLQSYVVCVLAGLFGARLGLLIVLAWLAAAALSVAAAPKRPAAGSPSPPCSSPATPSSWPSAGRAWPHS